MAITKEELLGTYKLGKRNVRLRRGEMGGKTVYFYRHKLRIVFVEHDELANWKHEFGNHILEGMTDANKARK